MSEPVTREQLVAILEDEESRGVEFKGVALRAIASMALYGFDAKSTFENSMSEPDEKNEEVS